MAPEERLTDAGVFLPVDASEDCSEPESLGMADQSDELVTNSHWAGHIGEVGLKKLVEEENDVDTICFSKPLDTSPACKGSELPDENHLGNLALVPLRTLSEDHLENTALVPHVTQGEESLENMALFPHVPQSLSMQALKERLKVKLKEKLKPKLRLNYFKHRQDSPAQVIPRILTEEVAFPHQNGEAALVAHYAHMKPFVSNVTPLKVLPAGVKTDPEQRILDNPPFFSLGREPTGQLVVANVSNGRKKAGNKTSQMSRVNRFAESILQFVGERSVPEKLIRGALGNNPDISKAIRLLLSEKRLKRLGDGGKGCAYVYVRTDLTEAKPKTKVLGQVGINAQALTIEREFVRELERRFPATNQIDSNVWNRCGRMQGDHLQCDV